MNFYLIVHRYIRTATIFAVDMSYEQIIQDMKAHPDWEEGRYERQGPVVVEGRGPGTENVESYWDTKVKKDYPVYEICVIKK